VVTALKSAGSRQLKNSFARWLITLGGISVLLTLVLIFLYLLYVIKPVFDSTQITPSRSVEISSSARVLSVGVDELKELAFNINRSGSIDFYQLTPSAQRPPGTQVLSKQLTEPGVTLEQVVDSGHNNKLLLDSQGQVRLMTPSFTASYGDNQRVINPAVRYPLGEEMLPVDEMQAPLQKLAFAMDDERAVFVAYTQDKRLIKTTLIAEDDFSYDPAYEALYQEIEQPVETVDDVLITPDLAMAFVRDGNRILVFSLDDD